MFLLEINSNGSTGTDPSENEYYMKMYTILQEQNLFEEQNFVWS